MTPWARPHFRVGKDIYPMKIISTTLLSLFKEASLRALPKGKDLP